MRINRLFITTIMLLTTACVGNAADSDTVPYDEGPHDNTQAETTCDGASNKCYSSCWSCAIDADCAPEHQACHADEQCSDLTECIRTCPEKDWHDCHDLCLVHHGTPKNTPFFELWNCVYCNTCQKTCESFPLNCATYDSYTPSTTAPPRDDLVWHTANLTWYESYPDPGSVECIEYNGCLWSGMFAAFQTQVPLSWVAANNIAAVHSDHWHTYKGKTLRVKQGVNEIDVKVYDMCSDNDCNGCCTRNSSETGFLIDLEKHTLERLQGHHGIAQWACLDC